MTSQPRTLPLLAWVALLTACAGDVHAPTAGQGGQAGQPAVGQLRMSFTMSGLDLDPDSAYVTVDDTARIVVRTGGATTLAVPAGVHVVELGGFANNCGVDGIARRELEVRTAKVRDVAFAVTCGAAFGVVDVRVETQGSEPDSNGYLVSVGSLLPQRIRDGGVGSFAPIPAGAQVLNVDDVASNCEVSGGKTVRGITVATGAAVRDTVRIVVSVVCGAPASTGIDVSIETAGVDRDDSYVLTFCTSQQWDCLWPEYRRTVSASSSHRVDLAPGLYYAWVEDVAGNCGQHWSGLEALTVRAGERKALRIDVTCQGSAELSATITATGTDRQQEFRLTVDGVGVAWLAADSTVTWRAVEGVRSIGLANIQENCRAVSANPVTVLLVSGVLTPVRFAVDCEPFAVLEVALTTVGDNIPPGFLLGVDPTWSGAGHPTRRSSPPMVLRRPSSIAVTMPCGWIRSRPTARSTAPTRSRCVKSPARELRWRLP